MNLRTVENRGSGLAPVPRRTINPSVNALLLSTQIPIGRRRKKSKKKTSQLDHAGSDGNDGDDETYHKSTRKVSSTSTVSTTPSLNNKPATNENVRGATHLTPSGSHVTIMERENPYVMGTGITLGRLSITPPHLSMVYSSESNDNDDDDEYESLFGQTYNDTNGLMQRLSGLARDSQPPYYATSPPDDMFASSISSASSIDYDPALATSAPTDDATTTATNEDDTIVVSNDTDVVTTTVNHNNNTAPVLAVPAATTAPSTNNNSPAMSAAASSRALARLPKRRTSLLSFSSKTSSSSRQVTCACPIPVSDHPLSEFGDDSEFGDESDAPSLGFPRTESFASFTDDDDMSGVDYAYPKKAASIASYDSGSVAGSIVAADDGALSAADAEAATAAAAVATTSVSTRSKLVSNITKSFKAFSNAASKFSTSQQAQVSSNSALFAFSPRSTDECMVMTDELNQAAAAAAADNAGCSHEEAASAAATSTASPRNIPLKTYNYSSTLLPVVRPREHRMNPDFLRVYASEALMRQRGKLDPDFVGRATMLLPPRTDNPDSFYRLKAGIDGEWEKVFGIRKRFVTKFDDKRCITAQKQVPARWIPINWDDCENCEGDANEDALETSVAHET